MVFGGLLNEQPSVGNSAIVFTLAMDDKYMSEMQWTLLTETPAEANRIYLSRVNKI